MGTDGSRKSAASDSAEMGAGLDWTGGGGGLQLTILDLAGSIYIARNRNIIVRADSRPLVRLAIKRTRFLHLSLNASVMHNWC